MKNKVFSSICIVLAIVIMTTAGATFAYLISSNTATGTISGTEFSYEVDMDVVTIHTADTLVPLLDERVSTAIQKESNKCIDKNNYEVCSLYKVTLTNTGEEQVVNGFVRTTTTNYETLNLKYQVFDSSYNAVTDPTSVSLTVNEMVYFSTGGVKNNITIGSTDIIYYVAVWLSDTNNPQDSDYSKSFMGTIGFESKYGDIIEGKFNT